MWQSAIWITTGRSTIWAARAILAAVAGVIAAVSPAVSAGPLAADPVAGAAAAPAPFSAAAAPALPPGWRLVGLPRRGLTDGVAATRFDTVIIGGTAVLRIRTDASYANLVWDLPRPHAAESQLAWRWRLDTALAQADLRVKRGDDSPLKLCVLFDLPLTRVPFIERSLLLIARALSGEPLPAATVCYVWDSRLGADTALPNAHSKRVRYLVLQGPDAPLGQWRSEQRAVAADFLRLFGDESPTVPPVIAIAVGADSDNTGGTSLSYIGDIRWLP